MHFRDRGKKDEEGPFDILQVTEAGHYGIAGISTGGGNWEIRLLARDSREGTWWLITSWRHLPEEWANRLVERLKNDLAQTPDRAPQEAHNRVQMEVRLKTIAVQIDV